MIKDWVESDIVSRLNKKNDIRIVGRTIYHLYGSKSRGDVGIGSKGKLDFLTKYCSYALVWVDEFKH